MPVSSLLFQGALFAFLAPPSSPAAVPSYPFAVGERLALDAGPFVAALEYAASTSAEIAGKPSAAFFAAAVSSLGLALDRSVAMVGDDLWSDVEGAQRAGLQGWLVRTGKVREDVLRSGSVRPDRVLESVAVLGS
jgi:ribonucleotide monophosphatase NagD (HAD superfamily)